MAEVKKIKIKAMEKAERQFAGEEAPSFDDHIPASNMNVWECNWDRGSEEKIPHMREGIADYDAPEGSRCLECHQRSVMFRKMLYSLGTVIVVLTVVIIVLAVRSVHG